MIAEQAVRAFWPLWTVVALTLAPLLMGWHESATLEVLWASGVVAALAGLGALVWGLRRFRLPTRAEAVARVDASLPGRPIAAVADTIAIGSSDPASQAVWRAHLARMEARTRAARAVQPDLRVSARDPYGTRFVALLFLVVALLFGSLWRVTAAPVTVRRQRVWRWRPARSGRAGSSRRAIPASRRSTSPTCRPAPSTCPRAVA